MEQATFGGGCFWCLEAVFKELRGVSRVVSGYAGGHVEQPTYQQVCTGTTGHVEVVQVDFDPAAISYRDLLQLFFAIHDPTSLDCQGADAGVQYRSIVFAHDEDQARLAREVIAQLDASGIYDKPIVTFVEPLSGFCPAEKYHQDYFARNPEQAYCTMVIAPKLAKFRQQFFERLRRDAPDA